MHNTPKNSILITGGAGYIGSHMVKAAKLEQYQVIVLDNLSTGAVDTLPDDVHFIEGDVDNEKLLCETIEKFKIEEIIHFAGSVDVAESMVHPEKYYQNNSFATFALMKSAAKMSVKRIIFSSTAAVYGENNQGFYNEHAETKPISPYGKSKLICEHIVKDLAERHNINYAILRYFNVAAAANEGGGRYSSRNATHLIRRSCQAALGVLPRLEIYGNQFDTPDGTGVRDFIHICDLVDIHAKTLLYLRENCVNITMNCGYGKGISVQEIVNAVKRVSNYNFETKIVNPRPGDIGKVIAEVSLLQKTLGWNPRFNSLEKIISDSLQAEKATLARTDLC